MYLAGHESILEDVFKVYTFNAKILNYEQLKTGLFYPDLPCGKYQYIDNKHVYMTEKKLCNMLSLLKLYDPKNNEFYEIVQSHKGILAFLHSMSPSPNYTAGEVREAILNQLISYFILAVYDEEIFTNKKPQIKQNSFWLGLILHVIMDSYSPAHTIRVNGKASRMVLPPRSPYTPSRIMRKNIREIIFEVIEETFQKDHPKTQDEFINIMIKKFKDNNKALDYIDRHKEQLYNSFLSFLFDKQVDTKATAILGKYKYFKKDKTPYQQYDIINFMYYNNQLGLYHQMKDFLYNIKIHPGMYKRMVDDCIFVLKLYEDVIEKRQRNIKKVLKILYKYLVENTYHMTPEHMLQQSGYLEIDS